MSNLHRRDFLKKAFGKAVRGAGSAAMSLSALEVFAKPAEKAAKKPKMALQLWTVRNEIEKSLEGTLAKVKSLGFDYVETAFFPEKVTIKQAGEALKNAGLKVCSIHCEMPEGEQKEVWLQMKEAYNCTKMIWHGWPETELYKTEAGISQLADSYNQANAFATENGLSFGLHNHWWELRAHPDGRLPLDILASKIDHDIFFEIDAYWAKVAGHEPADVITWFARRTPFMHIKDGPGKTPDDYMVAVGTGTQNFPEILEASKGNLEWAVVEFDRCETDIFEALEKSVGYLKGKKLVG